MVSLIIRLQLHTPNHRKKELRKTGEKEEHEKKPRERADTEKKNWREKPRGKKNRGLQVEKLGKKRAEPREQREETQEKK